MRRTLTIASGLLLACMAQLTPATAQQAEEPKIGLEGYCPFVLSKATSG